MFRFENIKLALWKVTQSVIILPAGIDSDDLLVSVLVDSIRTRKLREDTVVTVLVV